MQNSYSDYSAHYSIDAHDMPMPEDYGRFRRHAEFRRFSLLARLLDTGRPMSVLDAGCGNGWLSEILASRGHRVSALDIGGDSLKRAKARLESRDTSVSFCSGDIYSLPFPDSFFDAAVASEIIEHLDRPDDAIKELARVVRPGGHVLITTPYRETIEYTLCIHCNKKTPVNAHLHSFDREKIESLATAAGLTADRFDVFMSRPMERLGLSGFTGFLPFGVWRMIDRIACAVFGKESFLALKAVKGE